MRGGADVAQKSLTWAEAHLTGKVEQNYAKTQQESGEADRQHPAGGGGVETGRFRRRLIVDVREATMNEVSAMRNGDEGEKEERTESEDEGFPLAERRGLAQPVRCATQEGHEEKTQERAHAQSDAHPLLRYASFEQKRRNISEAR